ncbi:hypothetical protein FCIRC_8331 [Fusarium circinatum]|uniref:DUF7730 domain-containing protein n=1 Tax=Fusarium circinatum TaxID=48490 RepID=A0A8H5TNH0_FUSCI|nr:hypothetical protein FCIRC_8331 [Fusarium circinatum]
MRFSSLLLAAGLSSSALAVEASLDPWEIDPSCNGFENDIKDALTQSIDLAEAARTSLEFLLAKMPDRNSDPDGAVKWARINAAAFSIFGFMGNPKGHDADTQKYIEDLRDIYAKTSNTLPSSQNNPAKGFSPILSQKPNAKPLIVCGDDVFQWYDVDQEPEPGVGRVRDQPAVSRYIQNGGQIAGAFYYANRWAFKPEKKDSVEYCIGNREAVISSSDDIVIICPKMTSDAGRARVTPRQYKTSAALGDHIMTNWVSNPTQLYHELMHWFGGVDSNLNHLIKDQVAVNEKGFLRYKHKVTGEVEYYTRTPSEQELRQKQQRKQATYGLRWIMNLARTYKDKNGNKSPYSGPKLATKNADSLALFSFMMYLDQFDWSKDEQFAANCIALVCTPGPACSPYFGPDRDWRDYKYLIPTLPSTRTRALTPPGFSDDEDKSLQRPTAAFQQSLWFKVPANLRRDILRLAFGDRRLHMHLAFDPSVCNTDLELDGLSAPDERDDPGHSQRKIWSWNGCICVRKFVPELGPMTRGGLNPGPWIDRCCDPINVPKPPPENIGIMGWLQSCRQNYAETIDVLYSTNTIVISGEATITELPSLIPSHHLAKITSLEIKAPITKDNVLEDVTNLILPSSRFPNLKRLYISVEWCGAGIYHPDPDELIASFDTLARTIKDCSFAIPMEWFSRISWGQMRSATTGRQITYSQFWRTLGNAEGDEDGYEGGLDVVQLPYADSYPRPPYHLESPGAGYWILEASEMSLSTHYDFLTGHYNDD